MVIYISMHIFFLGTYITYQMNIKDTRNLLRFIPPSSLTATEQTILGGSDLFCLTALQNLASHHFTCKNDMLNDMLHYGSPSVFFFLHLLACRSY